MGIIKNLASIAAGIVIAALCSYAGSISIEDISPHLASNAQIVWVARTNDLPKFAWTYQKRPQSFSAVLVSNAAALGEFKLNSFPKSFDKRVVVWDRAMESDPRPDYFDVEPILGFVSFQRERRSVSAGDFDPEGSIKRAWLYAAQLGLDKAQFAKASIEDSTVFLPRKVDGISFNQESEGFTIRYGAHGEIRNLDLNWPKLERVAQEKVIGPEKIMQCIRALKTPVLPQPDETNYFARVKTLSTVKKFTIKSITPYYLEGKLGEQPDETEPAKIVGPIAALDVVADWGSSNAPVRLFAPLIASDAKRLLAVKTDHR